MAKKGGRPMGSKERNIILEALKCLRYDTERVEKLVLKTKSATAEDHSEVIEKLQYIDELLKKWRMDV
jgi:hypothetical protein